MSTGCPRKVSAPELSGCTWSSISSDSRQIQIAEAENCIEPEVLGFDDLEQAIQFVAEELACVGDDHSACQSHGEESA